MAVCDQVAAIGMRRNAKAVMRACLASGVSASHMNDNKRPAMQDIRTAAVNQKKPSER